MVDSAISSSPSTPALTSHEAVLFDLDGVVTPTALIHQQAWREVFEEVLPVLGEGQQKIYADRDYFEHLDGRSRYEGVQRLLEAHGVDLDQGSPADQSGMGSICAVGNLKNDRFLDILGREAIVAYPGSIEVLSKLDHWGVSMAIVSSSANAKAVLTSAGLIDRFDVIVDGKVIAELGLRGKPHPDPFLEAARQLGVDPARAVVVEDAIAGVEAGSAGGFGLVVGVARDIEADRLYEVGADVVVADLSELI